MNPLEPVTRTIIGWDQYWIRVERGVTRLRYHHTPSTFTTLCVHTVSPHLRSAIIAGTGANLTSTIALALCGRRETGSAAGPVNGPSQWLWGEHEAYTREATWRHTATGYGIHHAMSIAWAFMYAHMCERRHASARQLCTSAATVAGLAYLVDYHVAPRRLRPGFKKHLGPRSIFAVYAAFAVGLAASAIGERLVRQRFGS